MFALALCPAAHAEGDAARGEKLFTRCSACHSTNGDRKTGPTLAGVVGRKAGTVEDTRFSKALVASNVVWTEETLQEYLTEPKKLVPGTSMTTRVPNAQDREDIISYLTTLK
jgi:cytochrome c